MKKECFKCGQVKDSSCFYRQRSNTDGLFGKCKECTKRDVLDNRKANIERIREYDRKRGKDPQRIARVTATVAAWRKKHPDRAKAQGVLYRAVRDGKLQRPDTCSRCGKKARIEAHHNDYSKPLEVLWVCKPCHYLADQERLKGR